MAVPAATTRTNPLPTIAPDPGAVARIRQGIDLRSRAGIATYGAEAQRGVAEFAGSYLRQAANKDAGPAGELLNDLLIKAKGLDPSELSKLTLVDRVRGGLKAKVVRYKERYSAVEPQIDRIKLELEKRADRLQRDIAMLDGLFERNIDQLRDLEAYIVAGEEELRHAREVRLPEIQEQVDKAGQGVEGQLLAQQAADLAQAVERFDQRVHDLKRVRLVGMQKMPQIRLIQNGDAVFVDKLTSTATTTISLWKDGMVIALALNNQAEAVAFEGAFNDATNLMIKRNADMMKSGAVNIEKAAQRGIVNIETLSYVNRSFIETLEDVLEVQRQGREARRQAEEDMKGLEIELRQAVTGARP